MTTLPQWLAEQKNLCGQKAIIARALEDATPESVIALWEALRIIEAMLAEVGKWDTGSSDTIQLQMVAERILNEGGGEKK